MSPPHRTLILVPVVATITAVAVAWATPTIRLGPAPVSSLLYPEQELEVTFDHAMHVDALGLTCTGCHPLAPQSSSPQDNLLPQEAACADCHDGTRPGGQGTPSPTAECAYCHPRATKASRIPPAKLHFSHATHNEVDCIRCHSRIPVRRLATADDLPTMPTCLSCHDGSTAARTCVTCHLAEPDGVLRTELGGARPLLPPDWMHGIQHMETWTDSHGPAAMQRTQLCNACHREHECLACHDGSIRPRDVHPGDWMSIHAAEARGGQQRCQSCHRGQSFCRTCHARAGVAQGSPPGRVVHTGARVHTDPQWSIGLRPRHGVEARRAITTCASCHTGQECVSCHAFVNPHPPGFNRRCGALVAARSAACAACHTSTADLCD